MGSVQSQNQPDQVALQLKNLMGEEKELVRVLAYALESKYMQDLQLTSKLIQNFELNQRIEHNPVTAKGQILLFENASTFFKVFEHVMKLDYELSIALDHAQELAHVLAQEQEGKNKTKKEEMVQEAKSNSDLARISFDELDKIILEQPNTQLRKLKNEYALAQEFERTLARANTITYSKSSALVATLAVALKHARNIILALGQKVE